MTAIFSVQNTDNSHHHVVCAEHRQFSLSCCMCRTQTNRTQTILTFMLCVQNTDNSHRDMLTLCLQKHRQFCHVECAEHRQTTDNSHRTCCVSEHRQFSLSCCVCRTQTILTVMLCVQNTDNCHCHAVCVEHRPNRTQTSLTVMLCVKNTDNSHRHVVCAEHRQFSPSCCVQNTDKQSTDNSHRQVVCRTQREHRQFSLSFCECRTQLGGGVDTSIMRCRRLRVVTVAPRTERWYQHSL